MVVEGGFSTKGGLSSEGGLVNVDSGILVDVGIRVLVDGEVGDLVGEAGGVLVREANGVFVGDVDGDLGREADEVLEGEVGGDWSSSSMILGWKVASRQQSTVHLGYWCQFLAGQTECSSPFSWMRRIPSMNPCMLLLSLGTLAPWWLRILI